MNTLADLSPGPETPPELQPLVDVLVGLFLVAVFLHEAVRKAAQDAETSYNRGELFLAYRNRHRWKASDRANLQTLPLNAAALRRLKRLEGKGRPVVKAHRDFSDAVAERLLPLAVVANGVAPSADRLPALKRLPWWPYFVESLYRGEYLLSKGRAEVAPSDSAEVRVGRALGISQSTVRRLSGDIRRQRRVNAEDEDFPSKTVADLEAWLRGLAAFPWD